jgi:ribosomal subunit interface protein
MNISVAGQHIDIGASLQEYVRGKITTMTSHYFDHTTSAAVHFTKEPHKFYFCDIIIHDGTGRHTVIKTDARANEVYASFDEALAKAERRLKKYKEKLKDHHGRVKISELDIDGIQDLDQE